jgi:hypothetical protein
MGFTDDRQLAACCRALCGRARLAYYWTLEGPTDAAIAIRDGRDPLSHGESILVRAAWAFWNGEGGLKFAEIIEALDADHAEAVCLLVVAMKRGGRAVDAWIERFGERATSR